MAVNILLLKQFIIDECRFSHNELDQEENIIMVPPSSQGK